MITLTQAEFDALPAYAGQQAADGLVFKKKAGDNWYRYTYTLVNGSFVIVDEMIDCFDYRRNIADKVGKDLIREIWRTLNASSLSDAVKASIGITITPVIVMILTGEIPGARIVAFNTSTTADFTNGRKNILLALIDAAVLTL